jgi:Domain of unknown function (DUF4873)
MTVLDDGDGYAGPATLRIGDTTFAVQADLRGQFEPIDGRYHWYGRLARSDELTASMPQGRATGLLSTPEGAAECELYDPDPWDRYRVSGISTPPFRAAISRPEMPA